MIGVTYALIEEKYKKGNEIRTSYGIAAYSGEETDGVSCIVKSIHDVSPDKEKMSSLVDNCNRLGLSIGHLCDVVEDFIS